MSSIKLWCLRIRADVPPCSNWSNGLSEPERRFRLRQLPVKKFHFSFMVWTYGVAPLSLLTRDECTWLRYPLCPRLHKLQCSIHQLGYMVGILAYVHYYLSGSPAAYRQGLESKGQERITI